MSDRELDELFSDPGLRQAAELLARSAPAAPEPDAAFRSQLRRQLMQEAWRAAEPRIPVWRRIFAPGPVAWAGAALGVALIAAATFAFLHPGADSTQQFGTWNVAGSTQVATTQVLTLSFAEPVDHAAVESAISIEPATNVSYAWAGNTLTITPSSGFAANTQYEVAMAPVRTPAGAVVQARPVTFTASPAPTAAPPATPAATPAPAAISSTRQGPGAGPVRPAWLDAGRLALAGSDGAVRVYTPATGDTYQLASDTGVRALAARADGNMLAEVTDAGVLQVAVPAAAATAPAPAGTPLAGSANALAAGYDASGRLWFATATAAGTAGGEPRRLSAAATGAWFSPAGDRLLFQSASGLRSLDLGTGAETAWPAGSYTVLGFAPDGRHVAYSTAAGVFAAAAADGSAPAKLAPTVATAGDWSRQDEILFTGGGAAWSVRGDGSGLRKLDDGDFGAPAWRPAGDSFAFLRGGSLYVAQVAPRATPPAGSDLGVAEAAGVVEQFMQARAAGRADAAQGFLDAQGRDAYSGAQGHASLLPSGLSRDFIVARQSTGQQAVFAVRLLLADHPSGRDVGQLDELITVVRDASGRPVVHAATASPVRPYGKGPEVVAVTVTGSEVRVEFDSSLKPASADAIALADAGGKTVATHPKVADRTAVLTLPPGAGVPLRLTVPATVADKDGRTGVAAYALDLYAVAPTD